MTIGIPIKPARKKTPYLKILLKYTILIHLLSIRVCFTVAKRWRSPFWDDCRELVLNFWKVFFAHYYGPFLIDSIKRVHLEIIDEIGPLIEIFCQVEPEPASSLAIVWNYPRIRKISFSTWTITTPEKAWLEASGCIGLKLSNFMQFRQITI